MNSSTARGLAGGGALISAASLLMPWYVLRAGDLQDIGRSGIDALGALSPVVLVLAIVAGWSGSVRIHRLLPAAASAVLTVFVLVKIASPPAVLEALGSTHGGAVESQLVDGFAAAFAAGMGLHYAPSWGIWVAAIGALAALVGTIVTAMQHRP